VRVFIGLETLMPYTFYKGALLTSEEYEKVKDELDKKEQEYLKLLLGEELESKEGPDEASFAEVAEASERPVDSREVHPKAEGSETADSTDSGESEVKPVRRKRQK
jgi:hypothetical protein